MLSYRHAFHAGNHGDVLKHLVLLECLHHLAGKDKPYLYIDTHAGAGSYTLDRGYAALNCEWAAGVAKLRAHVSRLDSMRFGNKAGSSAVDSGAEGYGKELASHGYGESQRVPDALVRYLKAIDDFTGYGDGSWYPGSPALAARFMRPVDRAVVCELHSSDHALLEERFSNDRRFKVLKTDGFTQLKAVLPPPSRRALILIDPSYELAQDYAFITTALKDALSRFSTGLYLVWYPLLERKEARELPVALEALADRLGPDSFLKAELRVRSSIPGEKGMAGSGMILFNPPWTLSTTLNECLPILAAALGNDQGAGWLVSSGN